MGEVQHVILIENTPLANLIHDPHHHILTRYMEKDYGFLFDEQVISYTAQGREFANALIVAATRRAMQMAYQQHEQQEEEQQQQQQEEEEQQ